MVAVVAVAAVQPHISVRVLHMPSITVTQQCATVLLTFWQDHSGKITVKVVVGAYQATARGADRDSAVIPSIPQVAEAAALQAVAAAVAVVELRRRTRQQPRVPAHQVFGRASRYEVCSAILSRVIHTDNTALSS